MAKRRGNLAVGGLLLAGLGYVAGLLTAPKSGRETRKDIQKTAANAKAETEKALKQAHTELNDLVSQGKKSVKDLTDKAKDELNAALEKGQTAKNKVSDALSALHEGESNDKDLQRAIDEANNAVTHLKKYVGKHANAKKA